MSLPAADQFSDLSDFHAIGCSPRMEQHDTLEKLRPLANNDSNFIDDLVNAFSRGNINHAALGYIDNYRSRQQCIAMAVDIKGDESGIRSVVKSIKEKYLPDQPMPFVSAQEYPQLYKGICAMEFPFYTKGQPQLLHQEIMRQWYYKRNWASLLNVLEKTPVFVYARNGKKNNLVTRANSPTDIFLPVYSSRAMITASRIVGMPNTIVPIELSWQELVKALGTPPSPASFELNPQSAFSIPFSLPK